MTDGAAASSLVHIWSMRTNFRHLPRMPPARARIGLAQGRRQSCPWPAMGPYTICHNRLCRERNVLILSHLHLSHLHLYLRVALSGHVLRAELRLCRFSEAPRIVSGGVLHGWSVDAITFVAPALALLWLAAALCVLGVAGWTFLAIDVFTALLGAVERHVAMPIRARSGQTSPGFDRCGQFWLMTANF